MGGKYDYNYIDIKSAISTDLIPVKIKKYLDCYKLVA